MEDKFKDIRPYNDNEVSSVLARLLANDQCIALFASLNLPRLNRVFPLLATGLTRNILKRQVRDIHSVDDIQRRIISYFNNMLLKTTRDFSCSGFRRLEKQSAYLFVSNHRDIVLDPAFLNYMLFENGFSTSRVAIGDNLLHKEFVGELMRLNKSFIVKRQVKKPREMLLNLRRLSSYIRHSILHDGESVWLAQREGRSKDGLDYTEPAILKMLAMSADKGSSLASSLNQLKIVPVAISYEYDPCDVLKAHELYTLEQEGSYQKSEGEDVESIGLGITGYKGNIHLSVGEAFHASSDEPADLAKQLDQQIAKAYVLHPSNFFAYQVLYDEYPALACGSEQKVFDVEDYQMQRAEFEARVQACSEQCRRYLLEAYANPLKNKLALA